MISHGNLHNFITWATREMSLGPDDVFSNHAGFHFDLSTFDLFACTASAGTLWLIPEDQAYAAKALARGIVEHGVTVWYSVPSVLSMLVASSALDRPTAAGLRYVLFAGEVFPVKHLRGLIDTLPSSTGLYNLYGPTETNVCTYFKVDAVDPERTAPVPIGRAISGASLEIVDEDGSRVEPGDDRTGELVVSGPCVTLGYWRRDDDPNTENHRRRTHATGDLVSFEGDELIYRGRKDRMIKLRGYRVELGEIEAVIASHESVDEAAVIAVDDDQSTRLVVYCSPAASTVPSESSPTAGTGGLTLMQMKTWCAANLPRYMIPNVLRRLDALPKTPNGKVDLRRLRQLWKLEQSEHTATSSQIPA
jgi:acyl-coenzyme A synthetase/AMP-(fatty) acid ligase